MILGIVSRLRRTTKYWSRQQIIGVVLAQFLLTNRATTYLSPTWLTDLPDYEPRFGLIIQKETPGILLKEVQAPAALTKCLGSNKDIIDGSCYQ